MTKDWANGLGTGLVAMAALMPSTLSAISAPLPEPPPKAEAFIFYEPPAPPTKEDTLEGKVEQFDFETAPEFFHEGQRAAWDRDEEVILILAGRQSGKTIFGPPWLAREIQRRGPGDYSFNGPSIELLRKKALPSFLAFFRKDHRLGKYNTSERTFTFSEYGLLRMFGTLDKDELFQRYALKDPETGEITEAKDLFEVKVVIYVGYARKPESLESATYKGVWSDESGQPDFKVESNEALQGRRSVNNARHLHTTTPYDLGWQMERIYEPCRDATKKYGKMDGDPEWVVGSTKGLTDPDGVAVEEMVVVRFETTMNPTQKPAKIERIRRSLAEWKFKLFYLAEYTRPAGIVYDVFDKTKDTYTGNLPKTYRRAVGLDFGTANTCAIKVAANPDDPDPEDPTIYVYWAYTPSSNGVDEHVANVRNREDRDLPAVGGAPSEDAWRDSFTGYGLPVDKPINPSLDAQITAVYGKFKRGKLKIHASLSRLIKELDSFSYELNESGEPISGKYRDERKYHRLAALRYVVSEIDRNPSFILTRADDVVDMDPTEEELDASDGAVY